MVSLAFNASDSFVYNCCRVHRFFENHDVWMINETALILCCYHNFNVDWNSVVRR